jgi:alanine-alpha-ketoisovalerate/valine-pyruvate aminotransferase
MKLSILGKRKSGDDNPWEHREGCIRLNYAMDNEEVSNGIEIIAEEVKRMWDGTG